MNSETGSAGVAPPLRGTPRAKSGRIARALVLVATMATTQLARAEVQEIDLESDADNYADVWLRLDADRVGLQSWVGGTKTWGAVDLAANLIVTQPYPDVVDPLAGAEYASVGDEYRAPIARLELGPAMSNGGLFVLPKIGLGYDFEREKVAPLVPQLMTIVQGGPLYVESWIQFYFKDLFDEGAQDSFYTRDMLLVALSNYWALGVQTEVTVAMKNGPDDKLRSWPVGARVNWSPVEQAAFGLFVAFETKKQARNSEDDFMSGRLTATYYW